MLLTSRPAFVRRLIIALLVTAIGCSLLLGTRHASVRAAASERPRLSASDRACAGCHAEIYRSYEQTSMARGSGLASESLHTGSFTQASSGVSYRVDSKDGIARLHTTRESAEAPLDTVDQLDYFIGSGKHGLTYLFRRPSPNGAQQLWYEAPVNWYTRRAGYGMAPAFDRSTTAPLALKTDANCLHCHATAVQQPLPGAAVNAFAGAPFLQGGVGCAACHGDAGEHLRTNGRAPMLKLAALTPSRHESVCLQCHLEGDALIEQPGKSVSLFRPGDELRDTAIYFVNASSPKSALRASSQYEGLLRSACRRAVGEQLTCTTCHDPHSTPAAAERVSFYRGKCLQCHTDSATFIAATHHPEQPDCAVCHMPSRTTSDISHEQNVDHDIEALPRSLAANNPQKLKLSTLGADPQTPARFTHAVDLVAVNAAAPDDRSLGLAYAQFAGKGDRESFVRAADLLGRVEHAGHADFRVHEQLGFLAQLSGRIDAARVEYGAALQGSPHDTAVLGNLAILQAQGGDAAGAMKSLHAAVEADPTQTAASLNLAMLECRAGDAKGAKALLNQALRYDPDSVEARVFLTRGDYAGAHCTVH